MFSSDVPRNVRTLFLSDFHLGYRLSHAERCLEVLDYFTAERIYLIGDIVDVSRMSRIWHWPPKHQQMVEKLSMTEAKGAAVFLLPGNHDQCFRFQNYFPELSSKYTQRLQILVEPLMRLNRQESFAYDTKSGKRLLIIHGDQFDTVNSRFLGIPRLGSRIFDRINLVFPNRVTLLLRDFFKILLARPRKIQAGAVEHARLEGFDGVIFGHLHQPFLSKVEEFVVGNTGDWIENESLMIETTDGKLQLFNFGEVISQLEV